MKTPKIATMLAILAAALYAINEPVSKLLMEHIRKPRPCAFDEGIKMFLSPDKVGAFILKKFKNVISAINIINE